MAYSRLPGVRTSTHSLDLSLFFFLAVLGLGCREGFSLVVANGGFSLVAV